MNETSYSNCITLEPVDNKRLAVLCGQGNENLRNFEDFLDVEIRQSGSDFQIFGNPKAVAVAAVALKKLYQETARSYAISSTHLMLILQESTATTSQVSSEKASISEIRTALASIKTRNLHQQKYVSNIRNATINFGVGPAGTGKTFLAVACAVEALEKQLVRRLILVRPAVEAGEKLGFLPGDMTQKVDPYLRPIYDALFETLGIEKVDRYIEKNIIEIAPLAYMRGRSLNDAFIILDEAQNTTSEQMKMFLTRIGFASKAVITGDITQHDLPKGKSSGLGHAIKILQNIDGICFTFFETKDVVRHPLVQRVIEAYQADTPDEDAK